MAACLSMPVVAEEKEPVDWDSAEFALHFDSEKGVMLENASYIENGVLVQSIRFKTPDMSTFGQVSVKRYDQELDFLYLNNTCIEEVGKKYNITGYENVLYAPTGQYVTAVTRPLNDHSDTEVTQAHVGFGYYVVIVIADAVNFEDVLKSLKFKNIP